MKIDWQAKPPGDVADYLIDFADQLADGETLTGKTVTAENVTLDSSAIEGSGLRLWLSGGTEGTTGRVFAAVQTSGNRTFNVIAVVPIGVLAVSLGRAKEYLRVDFDTDDNLITLLLRSGIAQVEKLTGHVLSPRVIEKRLNSFPSAEIALPFEPVSEVVSVTYVDTDGASATMAEADYRVVDGDPYMLLPAINGSWPSAYLQPGAVRVRALAGYEAGLLPADLERAVLMLVAHGYENREAVTSSAANEVPLGVQSLCWPYRRLLIG